MKFLMSIYGNDETWSSLPREQWEKLRDDTDAHNTALFASGELLGAYGVSEPVSIKRVRVTDGVPVVSDGPYIETKEYLGSFYVVDCESLERALEIAAGMPSATLTDIEVHPLTHGGSAEDF